ncbi:hypothetical protein P4501_24690, partial [Bacillus thuringiensis]|nr:hypothetical protein [Bacillus thuringiensis]
SDVAVPQNVKTHKNDKISTSVFTGCAYFIILAKKTPSSRSVKKGHCPLSRWGMNWLGTMDGRKPS